MEMIEPSPYPPPQGGRETNEKFKIKWLDYLRVERGLSQNALDAYSHDLKLFLGFLSTHTIDLSDVRPSTITDFLFEQQDQGKSSASLIRYLQAIRHFFRFMVVENHLPKNPAEVIPLPKKPERLPAMI
jgi:integrase/recombinase XerD